MAYGRNLKWLPFRVSTVMGIHASHMMGKSYFLNPADRFVLVIHIRAKPISGSWSGQLRGGGSGTDSPARLLPPRLETQEGVGTQPSRAPRDRIVRESLGSHCSRGGNQPQRPVHQRSLLAAGRDARANHERSVLRGMPVAREAALTLFPYRSTSCTASAGERETVRVAGLGVSPKSKWHA